MSTNLHYANQCAKEFKPIIEEKLGVKLEDMHSKPEYTTDNYSDRTMFVTPFYRNTIFMDEENCCSKWYSIAKGVVHELSHLVHDQLIKEKGETIKSNLAKKWFFGRYYTNRAFREGFCEYMSLTDLIDIYDEQDFRKVARSAGLTGGYFDFLPCFKPYETGYKFFRKVLGVIGKDKVLEVARSPPISEIEVKMPLLYLLRKYPQQAIRSIPKFLRENIRKRIFKRSHGYAPLGF